MQISGFQPLSLIDYPEHTCAIVFTQGCPFRCAYCHNPELVYAGKGILDAAAVMQELERIKGLINGVTVTGGEPTMQADLPEFLQKIHAMGLKVKLDTNGSNPEMLKRMLNDKLIDYIAMDIKSPWESYANIVGTTNDVILANVKRTFEIIQASGVPHEFRTTLVPGMHTEADVRTMLGYLRDGERYAFQDFREGKTLDPTLEAKGDFVVKDTYEKMKEEFPKLELILR